MKAVTLTVTTRLRWWFKPAMYALLAWARITGHRPSDAWLTKWARRAIALEVKP